MFIDIENIKKSYGEGENKFQVLKGISFEVEKGEMGKHDELIKNNGIYSRFVSERKEAIGFKL